MSSNIKTLTLHAHKTGPNPYKVSIILELLGLPYDVKVWEFGDNPKNGVKGKTFLALNENGRVPTLEDPNTGVVSWESAAIINYLLRVYDKQNKFGPGKSEQEQVDYEKWIAVLISTFGPMMGQLNWFKHYHNTTNEDAIKRYDEQTNQYYGLLESQLKKSGSGFVLQQGFSAVDAHYYPWVYQHDLAEVDLNKYPTITQWFQKIKEMPEVQKAYSAIENGQKM